MKIAGKINLLFLATALTLSCAVALLVARNGYQSELESLVLEAQAKVLSRPNLQLQIYRQDETGLEGNLQKFLEPAAIVFARAYDSLGESLALREDSGYAGAGRMQLREIRAGLSAAETGLTGRSPGQDGGESFWSSLSSSSLPLRLTIPVFSALDPSQRGLEALDFAKALTQTNSNQSLLVIGYVEFGIDRSSLLASARKGAIQALIAGLAISLLGGVIIIVFTRRITRPLAQLEQLADEISSGNRSQGAAFDGGKEFENIANLINSMFGDMDSYKKEIGAGQHLLELKVGESASQLSQRNEELSKAAEEITRTKHQLNRLAYYDSLTSLPNRRLFTEQLAMLLKLNQREQKPIALLFVDLDKFKRINDSLGHSTGDLLLREVGKRMTKCLRDSDLLAHYAESEAGIDVSRLGSDEFTVVLNHLDNIESAGMVAQRLVATLGEPMMIDDHELVISPTVGIALAPRDGGDVESLLKAADIAMHHAKAAVGSDFLYYNSEMDPDQSDQFKLESDLRKAIERKQLLLHYQPQVDTVRGTIVGAEALLRWQHPELGMVPPLKFIAIAEEIGLIEELGDWVLVEACRQMHELRQRQLELPRVAINISMFQFNGNFVERIRDVLHRNELPAAMLELGLSEELLINNDLNVLESLRELSEMGVYLSVDNFGTSYAPISYLSHYPLDEIKIDRSFVNDCDTRSESGRLVQAMIAMAKSLKFNVVAEGVETQSQCLFLNENGANVVQGYLFSKPVPAEALQPLLTPWHFMEQIQSFAAETSKGL